MGKIVVFSEKKEPTLRGQARCLACRQQWEAVTPEGTIDCLECPTCGLQKGVLIGLCDPESGMRWVCDCGCDLYFCLVDGMQCLMCGVLQKGF